MCLWLPNPQSRKLDRLPFIVFPEALQAPVPHLVREFNYWVDSSGGGLRVHSHLE